MALFDEIKSLKDFLSGGLSSPREEEEKKKKSSIFSPSTTYSFNTPDKKYSIFEKQPKTPPRINEQNIPVQIAQGTLRSFGYAGSFLKNLTKGKLSTEITPSENKKIREAQSKLFGESYINKKKGPSITSEGRDVLSIFGKGKENTFSGKYAAPFIGFGLTALDVIPGGKSAGKKAIEEFGPDIVKLFTKEIDPKIIERQLLDKGASVSIAKRAAEDIAKTSDEKQVTRILNSFYVNPPIRKTVSYSDPKQYDNIDDFVKSQGTPVYRGGKTEGSSFTTSKVVADDFAKNRGGAVSDYVIKPVAKTINYDDIPGIKYKGISDDNIAKYVIPTGKSKLEFMENVLEQDYAKASKWAKDNGYDVVKFGTEGELRILNKDAVIPKKELEDIWKVSENITPPARTADDFKGMKERSLPKTLEKQQAITQEVKSKMSQQGTMYQPESPRKALDAAKKLVDENIDEARATFFRGPVGTADVKINLALGKSIIDKYDDVVFSLKRQLDTLTGEAKEAAKSRISKLEDEAAEVTNVLSERLTELGQGIQIFAETAANVSPTVRVKTVMKKLDKANDALKEVGGQPVKLTDGEVEAIKELQSLSKNTEVTDLKKAYQYKIEALVYDKIRQGLPKTIKMFSFLNKYRYMAMLLNAKTAIRNVVGNLTFNQLENVAQYLSSGIDRLTAFRTGARTVTVPQWKQYFKGLKQGWIDGRLEIKNGVALDAATKERYTLPDTTFTSKTGKAFENALGYVTKGIDKPFYVANFESELAGLMKINKVTEPTEEMIELATDAALYRTFQDGSKLVDALSFIRKAGNVAKIGPTKGPLSGYGLGLGDLIMPFVRTPANLINRSIAYTPANLARGFYLMQKVLRKGKLVSPREQRAAVEALSRGTLGVGIVGLGALALETGVLTPTYNRDQAEGESTKKSLGILPYQLNVTALKRLLSGQGAGFKEGDRLVSIDWMQPVAASLAVGAILKDIEKKNIVSPWTAIDTLAGTLEASVNMVGDQPLIKGTRALFQGFEGLGTNFINALAAIPQSFIPSIVNQLRQFVDPTARQIDKRDWRSQVTDSLKNRIPWLSKTLAPQVDLYGENITALPQQDDNGTMTNLFNAFINPAMVTKFNKDPKEAAFLYQLFVNSGEQGVLPRDLISGSINVNGVSVSPDPDTMAVMQRYAGYTARAKVNELMNNKNFMKLSLEEKVDVIQTEMKDIATSAKIIYLDQEVKKNTSKKARFYANEFEKYSKGYKKYLQKKYGIEF